MTIILRVNELKQALIYCQLCYLQLLAKKWAILKGFDITLSGLYCRMPARRDLGRIALAPGCDETRASDPIVRQLKDTSQHKTCFTKAG